MSHEEDDSVLKYTIEKINHRLPVVVGAGSQLIPKPLLIKVSDAKKSMPIIY